MSGFSKRLETLMRQRSLGIREAARIAGVGPSTIVSWRSGARPVNYIALKKLATALGVDLDYLLTGEVAAKQQGNTSATTPASAGSMARAEDRVPLFRYAPNEGPNEPLFDGIVRVRLERVGLCK